MEMSKDGLIHNHTKRGKGPSKPKEAICGCIAITDSTSDVKDIKSTQEEHATSCIMHLDYHKRDDKGKSLSKERELRKSYAS